MNKIRILIAEDHTVVRAALRMLLARENDMEVVGETDNGQQAVALARKLRPNLVLMDVSLPVLSGAEATLQIHQGTPSAKILVLSSYGDDELVAQLLENGATSYLIKQSASDHLLRGIRETHQGKSVFSPTIDSRFARMRRDAFTAGVQPSRPASRLTPRENQVLQLIAQGYAGKQIADAMSITPKTVEKHRQQVMDKLNIHHIAGLTRYAISRGLAKIGATTNYCSNALNRPRSFS